MNSHLQILINAMGFYPVCPGSDQYVIRTPLLEKAVINFENGKIFTVEPNNISEKTSILNRLI